MTDLDSPKKYLAFIDVETPNSRNDRICSIGVVQTDFQCNVIKTVSSLVDPEVPFDDMYTSIHGIAESDVVYEPTFSELWDDWLRKVFKKSVIVAHNASFDLAVLAKCIDAYDIDMPQIIFCDTIAQARNAYPGMQSYKLTSLCERFGFDIDNHHDAMSDAVACCQVFWAIAGETNSFPDFEDYEYRASRKQSISKRIFSDKTQAVRAMKSFAEKVIADDAVSIEEANEILSLCETLPDLANDRALNPILGTIRESVADGVIAESESAEIVRALTHFVNPITEQDEQPGFEIDGKTFVLTGRFEHGTKSDIENIITDKGGVIGKSVTKSCDYVVVGGKGNTAWSMGNYGSKVKAALNWQAKGIPIQIMSEYSFYESI